MIEEALPGLSLTAVLQAGWQAERMPRRPGVPRPPRDYVTRGGEWPAGPFESDAPATVIVAAQIVTTLRLAIDARGWSNTEAAAEIGIGRQALQNLLSGRTIPDMHTLVQAETTLEVSLWPNTGPL